MILPSKKLLETVLSKTVTEVTLSGSDIIFDRSVYLDSEPTGEDYVFSDSTKSINIYELAHKCKEWARSKGFILLTYGEMYYNVDIHYSAHKSKYGKLAFEDSAQTEPETIFKACEWILKREVVND